MNHLARAASLVLALAGTFAVAGDEAPVALYAPTEGLVITHRIEKGVYSVAWELSRTLIAEELADPKRWTPPRQILRVPVPEAGAFDGVHAVGGAFLKATVTTDGTTLVLALAHQDYRPPTAPAVAALAPTEAGLAPTLEAIARAWNGEQGRRLATALRAAARRGQGAAVQRHLMALGHCYAGELASAAKLGDATLRELAKLVGVDTTGTADALAQRLSTALAGARLGARFVPAPGVRRVPTRGAVAGEVGRAVLHGVIAAGELDDWWELDVTPGVEVSAVEAPAGLAWFAVEDLAEPTKLRIRVYAHTATPLAYALHVRNKHGSDTRAIELYERPSDSPGLPYE